MITAASLRSRTMKDLAQLAKKQGLRGWHAMRKDQLVRALVSSAKPVRPSTKKSAKKKIPSRRAPARTSVRKAASSARKISTSAKLNGAAKTNGVARTSRSKKATTTKVVHAPSKPRRPRSLRRLRELRDAQSRWKNLAVKSPTCKIAGVTKDRLVVMVRDPFWLHAYWEVSQQSVDRAEAALGPHWHIARPVLRLYEVNQEGVGSSAERLLENLDVHGGVNNWYVEVIDPPNTYRLDIGYLAGEDNYYSIAHSNKVSTPAADGSDAMDENWAAIARDFDRIFALSGGEVREGGSTELQELLEERLKRPMGSPMRTRFGAGVENLGDDSLDRLNFEVNAEVIVFGAADVGSYVTLRGEPIRLRPDGTFTIRLAMPDKRQVIPLVASSADGVEQRTVVLAIERNTKHMEPVIRELND